MESTLGVGKKSLALRCLAALLVCLSSHRLLATSQSSLATAEELTLPPYLRGVLDEHKPVLDMLPSGEGSIWLITKGSLWLWRLEAKGLTHINLDRDDQSFSPLQTLGSDGFAIFAASSTHLFQLNWPERRVFQYDLPKGPHAATLGFSGQGDNFRIVHTQGLLHFDRYGKMVKNDKKFHNILENDHIKFQPSNQTLWRTRGKFLEQADLSSNDLKFRMLIKTHNPVLDMALDGPGIVMHTNYTVLRIGSNGKITKSIPVTGQRKLLAMYIQPKLHAYIFSDQLLEIYWPAKERFIRAKLTTPPGAKIKKLIVEANIAAVLTDQGIHAFKLNIME